MLHVRNRSLCPKENTICARFYRCFFFSSLSFPLFEGGLRVQVGIERKPLIWKEKAKRKRKEKWASWSFFSFFAICVSGRQASERARSRLVIKISWYFRRKRRKIIEAMRCKISNALVKEKGEEFFSRTNIHVQDKLQVMLLLNQVRHSR